MSFGPGALNASGVYVGSTPAIAVYLGPTQVWSSAVTPAFVNLGQTMALGARTRVAPWVPNQFYPSTVVVNNEIIVAGQGPATITVNLKRPGTTYTLYGWIMVNDVQVWAGTSGGTTVLGTVPVTLNPGDRVRAEVQQASGSTGGNRQLTAGDATYLSVDPAPTT